MCINLPSAGFHNFKVFYEFKNVLAFAKLKVCTLKLPLDKLPIPHCRLFLCKRNFDICQHPL